MNTLKMLEMYLKEHNIRCHIPVDTYRGSNPEPDRIKVHLKHMDINDEISLSVSQVILTIENGTKVHGSLPKKHRWDVAETIEVADLSDPQAFERIRLWIRQQETTLRYSSEAQNALARLTDSPYAQQVKLLEGDIENGSNLDIDMILEDLKPTMPLTVSNNPDIKVEPKENDPTT